MDLNQIVRFGAVGVINTLFSFGIYVVLLWLGLHFAAANLLATVAGVFFSFRTHGNWVFNHREWSALRRYLPVWGLCYALNVGLIALFVHSGFDAYIAGALAILPTVAVAYILQRRFVFVARAPRNGPGA